MDGLSAPRRTRILLIQALSVSVLLGLWELAARVRWIDPLFVPAPSAVARAFGEMGAGAVHALGETLLKTAIAYALAVVLGVTAGIVVGSVRPLRDVLNPFIVAAYRV